MVAKGASPFQWQPPVEEILRRLMNLLDRAKLRFDPQFVTGSEQVLLDALSAGNGVLLVGVHQSLNAVVRRYLEDRGIEMLAILRDVRPIPGTQVKGTFIRRGNGLMLKVRRHWKNGGMVGALIDDGRPGKHREGVLMEKGSSVYFSDALLTLAFTCGAQVLHLTTALEADGRIIGLLYGGKVENS